jgi:hypothetical protein
MQRHLFTVLTQLLIAFAVHAEPTRLAVVATDRTLDSAADVLTVALSKEAGVTLLERGEINRILGEQQLTAVSAGECVRVGRLLGADGLIVLRHAQVQSQELLVADLVSVGLGFRLEVFAHRQPVENFDSWSSAIKDRFTPLFPKLGVQPSNAVPVSLLNLRSAVGTTEAKVLERSLNFLLAARLVRDPQVFVLERQHLGSLEFDKDFIAPTGLPEWTTARFVTDGEIQLSGPDQDRVILQMKIEPPQDRSASVFTITGSRTNLGDLVDQAAAKILTAIGQPSQVSEWQAQAEAERFRREAFSAERAGLDDEALSAGEASHALGYRSGELIGLLARQNCRKAFPRRGNLSEGYARSQVDPAALDLGLVQHALELANTQTNQSPELEILFTAARMIRYFRETDSYNAHRQELATLRTDLRLTVQRITNQKKSLNSLEFWGFLGSYAPYLYDDPGQVLECYRLALQQKSFLGRPANNPYAVARTRHYLTEARDTPRLFGIQAERTPWLVGWRQESPETLNQFWQGFLDQMSQSTNVNDRLDGLLFRLYSVDNQASREAIDNQIREALWNARQSIANDTFTYAIAIQLLYAIGGPDEAFRFKLLNYFFQEATFYDYEIFERGLTWVNDQGGFGFTKPEYRSALLKSMDAYGLRVRGQRDFQAAEFAKYRKRLVEAGPEVTAAGSPRVLLLKRAWCPSAFDSPWLGARGFAIRKVIYRDSRVWALERGATLGSSRTNVIWMKVFQVDPETLTETSLDVPMLEPTTRSQAFDMDYDFEVSPEFVFIATQGKVLRYDRILKTWASTQVPPSDFPSLTFLGTNLYFAFPGHMGRWGKAQPESGIVCIDPHTLEQQVLASNRRKQSPTVLDDVPAYKVPSLFLGPGGALHAVVNYEGARRGENLKVFRYGETTKDWTRVLADELEGNKGRFGLLAFPTEDGALLQRLEVTSRSSEFALMHYRRDGGLDRLIAPRDSLTNTPRSAPWLAPEAPWDYSNPPSTPLVATRNGKDYWVLLKYLTATNDSLALYHYVPGLETPVIIPIAFAPQAKGVTNLDPCLFATPAGLLVGNTGGAAFWIIPWPELEGFLMAGQEANLRK